MSEMVIECADWDIEFEGEHYYRIQERGKSAVWAYRNSEYATEIERDNPLYAELEVAFQKLQREKSNK